MDFEYQAEVNVMDRVGFGDNEFKNLTPEEKFLFNVKNTLESLKSLKSFNDIISKNTIVNIEEYTKKISFPEYKNVLGFCLGYIYFIFLETMGIDEAIRKILTLSNNIPADIGDIKNYDVLKYIRFWNKMEEIDFE